MSWAVEEWKEGLPSRALQKIQELEGQLDKLRKERQQRQFQLDSLEAALQKQKQKVENEKSEGVNLKRENQSLMETCENLERARQRLSHELQARDSQVNFQEGQLSSSRKQIEKLEQELKRCKSELERSQQSALPADVSLNPGSTPQKPLPTPLTPSQCYSGSRYEDLKEKYNKEVEERKRLEAEIKALQAKKASPAPPPSARSHREIARQQAASSVFPWQQEETPGRLPSSARRTPGRMDFRAAHFVGEQETTPCRSTLQTGKRDPESSCWDNSGPSHLLDQLKAENQELRSRTGDLELRLQGQEKELKSRGSKAHELQLQLEAARAELAEKEKVSNRTRDELVRTAAQCEQASTKCAALEQKLKKLTEDLSCQRQNAESARLSLEQKMKQREKEFQQELGQQQQSLQTLDQEYTQTRARLGQELQQARAARLLLQAELEKVTTAKQRLEQSLEELEQKFCRTEEALGASQAREGELRRASEEMKKENSLLQSQSEQRAREACDLQEELRKAQWSLHQSQTSAEEMTAKNTSQETELRDLQKKIAQQENSLTLEKLTLALADLEKQRDCSQDLLKKREHHIGQLNEKLIRAERESQALLSALELKEQEYEELKEEKTLLTRWKSEKEQLLNQAEMEKETLQSKINHLEACLRAQQVKSQEYNEKVTTMEMERENLNAEIRTLHSIIGSRSREVEAQRQACAELQRRAEVVERQHEEAMEHMRLRASQLSGQVEELERKVQVLSGDVLEKDQRYRDLHAEYESSRGLVQPGGSPKTKDEHHRGLPPSEGQPTITGEEGSWPSGKSRGQWEAEQRPADLAVSQTTVDSLEVSLESRRQVNSALQPHWDAWVQVRGAADGDCLGAEQVRHSFVAETSQHVRKVQEGTSACQNVIAATQAALGSKGRELQLLCERLGSQQAECQELQRSSGLLEDSLTRLQLWSETLTSEKAKVRSVLSLGKQEIEELTRENGVLKDVNSTLNQEKMDLLQKMESLSSCIGEREKSISELSDQLKQEKLALLQRCEETENVLECLKENHETVLETNSRLKRLLSEATSLCEDRKEELEQLKETFARDHQALSMKLASAEERNQRLLLEVGTVQRELTAEMADIQNSARGEVDSLRQEISTLKADQSRMRQAVNALQEENERLVESMKMTPGHLSLAPEPMSDSVEETEQGMNHCDTEDPSLGSYSTQLVQLEAVIRNTELKLEASEKEKASLQQELLKMREELEKGDSQPSAQSREMRGLQDAEVSAEERYASLLLELATSQSDNTRLQCSLQAVTAKLSELEKVRENVQPGKHTLTSELSHSRSERVPATSKVTDELGGLESDMKALKSESALLQGEFTEPAPGGGFGEDLNVSWNPLGNSSCCEHLTLPNTEVQVPFAESQERFSSLQSGQRDEPCQRSSERSELQSCVDTLKAENSVLSMNLRNFQDDLAEEVMLGLEEGRLLSLSFSCGTDSPSCKSLGESLFGKDLLEQTGEISFLNNVDKSLPASQSSVADVSRGHLDVESPTGKEVPSVRERGTEELEALCREYLRSLRKLEEELETQQIVKNREVQELEQLLCSTRSELEGLQRRCLSESEQWQQRLTSVRAEMESQLAAEKQQTAHLSLELEAARLQLQGLDLSSRTWLGTDLEAALQGGNESCNIQDTEERTPTVGGGGSLKHSFHQVHDEDGPQGLGLETANTAETSAVDQTGRLSGALTLDAGSETLLDGRAQSSAECGSQPSFSDPPALVPQDVLETAVTIRNLQLQVKEASDENLKLLQVIEERDKKLESLLTEMKELDSKVGLQEGQLAAKTEVCVVLEKTIEELKKENSDLSEKLEFFSSDNMGLAQKGRTLEVLSSKLKNTGHLSDDATDGDGAMERDSWKEKLPDIEEELERLRSETASVEDHAFCMDTHSETFQTGKLYLEKDGESQQEVITCLEEELSAAPAERDRLHGGLGTTSTENAEPSQMSERVRETAQELGRRQSEGVRHMCAAEALAAENRALLRASSSEVDRLGQEKAQLLGQLQGLEEASLALSLLKAELENRVGQLSEERDVLVRDLESLQNKLSESEREKVAQARALEEALVEKGEVAARLSSTQGEARQLRDGIERLKVRIEADERKQRHVLEKLRESERHRESLQDKVENLERELQMSEENQELVILDAENSKAEVETLKETIDEMAEKLKGLESDLVSVRSEKETLTEQLREKQSRVLELEPLLSSLKGQIEEKEREKTELEEQSEATLELLQTQLKELNMELTALCGDRETSVPEGESLGPPGDEVRQLRASLEELRGRMAADERRQVGVVEKLRESEQNAGLLKERLEDLERELEVAGKNQELAVLDAENSRAEVETLKETIDEMAEKLKGLESDLVSVRSEKETLTEQLQEKQSRVLELEPLLSSLKGQIEEKEREKTELEEQSEATLELLQTQLKELNMELTALCGDRETSVPEGESLGPPGDEVRQLRASLEELRGRMAADERRQVGVVEKLRESEQNAGLLKERLEDLERELEVAGKNQELAVLDAENSRTEVETLKETIDEMAEKLKGLESDLVSVRSEKETLTEQLQEKQSRVLELEPLLSSLKSQIEEKEREKIALEESKTAVGLLQTGLKELHKEITALCGGRETSVPEGESLGPPGDEVRQLRASLEELRGRMAADERRQVGVVEKLQESEQNAGLLKERLEDLERELEVAGKNQELAVLDAENSRAEVETLKIKMDKLIQNLRDLELDLASKRSEKESLAKELQAERGRVSQLESLTSSLGKLLQEKEQEAIQTSASHAAAGLLQAQLTELNEKVTALHVDQETRKAEAQALSGQVDALEREKTQLLQDLEEAKNHGMSLQSSVDGLAEEVEAGRRELEKQQEEVSALKAQVHEREQLASKLSQVEAEQQLWMKQRAELGSRTLELEQRVQVLQSQNADLQDTLDGLRGAHQDLQSELESTRLEKMAFVEKVNTMTAKEAELRREMQEAAQEAAAAREVWDRERGSLAAELTLASVEVRSGQVQLRALTLENCELKKRLDCAHKERVEKEESLRAEIAGYQARLQESEPATQADRERLASQEERLRSQQQEVDLLTARKEELEASLQAAGRAVDDLKKTKTDNVKHISQLKKTNEHAQGKIQLLIKSCKQLEEEKETLQRQLSQLETARAAQETGTVVEADVDGLMTEVKELKEALEEKAREADGYLDKYCALLITHEGLEKAKEMLEMQVARLSQRAGSRLQGSPLPEAPVPAPSPVPSVTDRKSSPGHTKASGKRQRSSDVWESRRGPAPSTPETFSKKSKRVARRGLRSAEDVEDPEFEPDGLPEVVRRGFADIPTGKASPYVLRRTTMATRARTSPRLAARKSTPSPLSLHKENLAESSKPTAGGSRPQKVRAASQSPASPGVTVQEPGVRSVTSRSLPEGRSANSPREGLRAKRGQSAPSPGTGPDPQSSENCRVQ